MTTRVSIITLLFFALWSLNANAGTGQSDTMLPINESIRIGKLDNQLTYYICHNDYPENRVSFHLAMRVGAMQEEDNQNGLAHFLEHMAFEGSEHFNGEGHLINDYLQSIGVVDVNAYTSFNSTLFLINDVPSTRQSAIDSCLLILNDWAHGLLLTDEEIEKERGVIREEWRMRQTTEWRIGEKTSPIVYSGTKYGYHDVIGKKEIIDNFPPQLLRDFYHMWYRPDNQAIIVIGDIDVNDIENRIKQMFSNLQFDDNAPQVINIAIPDNEKPIVVVEKDKDLQYDRIQVVFKQEHVSREQKCEYGYFRYRFIREIISEMLTQRLSEMSQDADCSFLWAIAGDCDFPTRDNEAFALDCFPKSGTHLQALKELVTQSMSAVKYGFTEGEYSLAKKNYLSQIEQQYSNRNHIGNASIADDCFNHYILNEPLLSIEQEYALVDDVINNITLDSVNQMLPELIHFDGYNLVISCYIRNDEQNDSTTPENILNTIEETLSTSIIDAYQDDTVPEVLMTELPQRGKIVSECHNDILDFVELELSNGAKVILKPTADNEDKIYMNAWQKGGRSVYDPKDRANLLLFPLVVNSSGKGHLSNLQLQKTLAGKQTGIKTYLYNHNDYITGISSNRDLETMFQLTHLQFTAINRDDKSFNQIIQYYENLYRNGGPESVTEYMDTINYISSGSHWLLKPLSSEDFQHVDYDRILQIAKERTANASNYTFFFTGSFDEKNIRPLIEQYIASLPSQGESTAHWGHQDIHPSGKIINHFTQEMETPKGYVFMNWHDTSMAYNLEHQIQSAMLGQILLKKYRERIREDEGAAYMVLASGWCTCEGNDPYTCIQVYIPVIPQACDQVLEIIKEEMVNASQSIDNQTIEGIKKSMLLEHENQIKKDDYWLGCIQLYEMYGIDKFTRYNEVVNSQTSESISAFARQLISANNSVEIVITPKQ